jgi:hypothetical protein
VKSSIVAALGWLLVVCSSANAGEYDEAISAAFPGYRIIQPSERGLSKEDMGVEEYERARKAPAVVAGRFNRDKFNDFAAFIIDPASKRREPPIQPDFPQGYDAYNGALVVCFGRGEGQYRCQTTFAHFNKMLLPHPWYLERITPGKRRCLGLGRIRPWEPLGSKLYAENIGSEKTIRFTTDALGVWPALGNAGGIMIFQPDGSFLDCSFD